MSSQHLFACFLYLGQAALAHEALAKLGQAHLLHWCLLYFLHLSVENKMRRIYLYSYENILFICCSSIEYYSKELRKLLNFVV